MWIEYGWELIEQYSLLWNNQVSCRTSHNISKKGYTCNDDLGLMMKKDRDLTEHSETSENWHTLHLNHVQHLPENVTCLRSTPSSALRFGIWWQRHVSRGGPWARLSGASKSWCWCWWNIPPKKTDQGNPFKEHLFKNQVYLCWGKTWFPIFDPIIL